MTNCTLYTVQVIFYMGIEKFKRLGARFMTHTHTKKRKRNNDDNEMGVPANTQVK